MTKIWLDQYATHIKQEVTIPDMSVTDMFQEKIATYSEQQAISF